MGQDYGQGQQGQRYLPPWPPQGQQQGQYQQPYQAPPQYQPPSQAARPVPKAKGKRNPVALGCLAVFLVAAVLFAWFLVSAYSKSSQIKAVTRDITVVNPAAVDVTLKITNTGSSPVTPACTVNASDSSGAYSGVNEGSLSSPIQPGQTVTTVMEVTITHQGAQYVTQATVSCTG